MRHWMLSCFDEQLPRSVCYDTLGASLLLALLALSVENEPAWLSD